MRISTPWFFQRGLAAIERTQAELARTQQQLASGRRLLAPADDPAATGRALDLDQALALNRQYQANAEHAVNRLSREESVLTSVANLLQRVRELTVQGNSPVLADEDRASIAQEIRHRLDELLDLANSRDASGDYLFSGHSSRTRPFTLAAGGAVRYAGDQGRRELQIGSETRVDISDSGSDVFLEIRNGNGTFAVAADAGNTGSAVIDQGSITDPSQWDGGSYTIGFSDATGTLRYTVRDAGGATIASGDYADGAAIGFRGISVTLSGQPAVGDEFTVAPSAHQDMFATVRSVLDALAINGTGTTSATRRANALARALADIDQALEKTVEVRARIGARLGTVESEQETNADFELYLQENISAIRDVDIAEAITRLTRGSASLEAAQRSFVAIQNLSLFDFL